MEQQRAHQTRYRIYFNCHPESGTMDLNQKDIGHNESSERINAHHGWAHVKYSSSRSFTQVGYIHVASQRGTSGSGH